MNYKNVCIINCFETYGQRVGLLYEFFKKRGANVSVYTSDFKHFEKEKNKDNKVDFKYFPTKPYKRNISLTRIQSHHRLAKTIFKTVEKEEFDLLWVLVPPNSFVKETVKTKLKKRNVKVIFDIIDLWPETLPIKKFKSTFPFLIWKNLRDKNLNEADAIVTECACFWKKLPENIQNKLYTIYLAKEIDMFESKPDLKDDCISLCYLGSINNIIDISAIAKLIESVSKIKPVEFHLIGDGEQKAGLLAECEKAGAKVIDHGRVYDLKEKQKIMDSCHFGLNCMKESVCVGLTMKSLDYFAAGLPILNNIHGDTWNFVEEKGIGFNFSDDMDTSVLGKYDFEMRSRIRKFFEENFGTNVFEENVSKVLESVEKANG